MTNFADMIPQPIIKAAESRSDLGGTLVLIGRHKDKDVYTYEYPVPMTIGMPELYLWDGKKVEVIEGEEALRLISSF